MKNLSQYFFRGLLTILPLGMTVYVLYLLVAWTESLAMTLIRPFVGEVYLPGMGIVLGVGVILGVGFLMCQASRLASCLGSNCPLPTCQW